MVEFWDLNAGQPKSSPARQATIRWHGSGTITTGNGQFTAVGDFRVPMRTMDDGELTGHGHYGGCTTPLTVANGTTRSGGWT
jgi:hypothetical protein